MKTTAPTITAPIDIKTFVDGIIKGGTPLADSLFARIIRPPTPGYKASLAVVHRPQEKFRRVSGKRIDLDVGALFENMDFYELGDTTHLPYAIDKLRVSGILGQSDILQIRVGETGEMSFFVSREAEDLKSSPLPCVRVLAGFEGLFMTQMPVRANLDEVTRLPPGFEQFQPAFEKLLQGLDTPEAQARFMDGVKWMAAAMQPAIEDLAKKMRASKSLDENDGGEQGNGKAP